MKRERLRRQKAEAVERKKTRLRRRKAQSEELIRQQKAQIEEHDRELSQLHEEYEAKEERREEEWQEMRKELKAQQDQLRHLTDLLQSKRHQQLSEALGLSEEQPREVLETHVAFEKGKVAVAEAQAVLIRQEQLPEYQLELLDLISRLQNHIDLLNNHMAALKERKEALEELECSGDKYTKELTECDQQLEKLRERLELAQSQLRSCEEKLQEYKENIKQCLGVMNECEGTLSLSLVELERCLDRLNLLREKLSNELSSLEQAIQRGKNLVGVLLRNVSRFLGYHDDQLEEKKTELQKYSKELEATENTIERCKKTLKEFEIELGKLKECIKKAKDPQPTGTVTAPRKPLHQFKNPCEKPTDDRTRFITQSEKSRDRPRLQDLQRLQGRGGRRVKVIEGVAAEWENLALALHFESSVIEIVRKDTFHQTEDACREMLRRWLEGQGGTRQPVNWRTLIDSLLEAGFVDIAENLHAIIEAH